MNPIFRTLSRLESVDVSNAENADAALKERAALLNTLEKADLRSLAPAAKKELQTRLLRLIQSDADIILEARAAMREIDRGRRNVRRGRDAARGYLAANPRIEPALDKDA